MTVLHPVQPTGLTVDWWGHATATVTLPSGRRVCTDPLLTDRLFHLRRYAPTPPAEAAEADAVLVSHLHADHLHVPSLRRFGRDVPLVVPAGAERLVRGRSVVAVRPGDVVEVAGLTVEVLPATHDDHRLPGSRVVATPVGYRVSEPGASVWFPGDTGLRDDLDGIAPVDLALVPVGGWGPSLDPHEHLDPERAAVAVRRVGAATAVPVHWGTFWPRVVRRSEHLFFSPGRRFATALGPGAAVLEPGGRLAP